MTPDIELMLKASLYEDKALLVKYAQNALANIKIIAEQDYPPSHQEDAMREIMVVASAALGRLI